MSPRTPVPANADEPEPVTGSLWMERKLTRPQRADLRKSGLSDFTIERSLLQNIPSGLLETYIHGWAKEGVSGLLIPYPHCGDFWRVKLFPPQQNLDGHTVKYLQEAGSTPRLYFGDKAWAERGDPSKLLWIVEGEKKALKMEQEGFACVGLGGIWNFMYRGKPIKDLNLIAFSQRPVLLLPDSDIWLDPQKKQPVFALAMELRARGAFCEAVELPQLKNEKCGADDYLVAWEREQTISKRRIVLVEDTAPKLPRLDDTTSETKLPRHDFSNNRLPIWTNERRWYKTWEQEKLDARERNEPPPLTQQEKDDLQKQCESVLTAADPLVPVAAYFSQIWGGDQRPLKIVYLAITTRLLEKRRGAPPCHVQINGPAGVGKSYAMDSVVDTFPETAFVRYDATSPRVMIYDAASLKHKAMIFSEADSLPGVAHGEDDNPAASMLRTTLQNGEASYKTTIQDKKAGGHTVKEIKKEGPTVLVTTTINRLAGEQLDSRCLATDIPDEAAQTVAAMKIMDDLEMGDAFPTPPPTLVAFQRYLQALAPIRVRVVFAHALSYFMQKNRADHRLLRDKARIVALIKAVAILRHLHRERDEKGVLLATYDDYQTVAELLEDAYESTATEASPKLRELVGAVAALSQLGGPRSQTALAGHLHISKQAVNKRLKTALKNGWLVNAETRPGYPATLVLGEPLPLRCGLPSVRQLRSWPRDPVTL